MTDPHKAGQERSFINEARRAQIVEAAVVTLDEIGYVNASLAQIAKRAGISTSLISYHFKDKQDLMDYALMSLLSAVEAYVLQRTKIEITVRDKLRTYIQSSLAYMGTHPRHHIALLEIVFNARTSENVPYYKLPGNEEDRLGLELEQLLREGQSKGEFREFNLAAMANAIRGAIDEYLSNPDAAAKLDLETYGTELVKIFDRATAWKE
jgi:TetR/AcrR family transcriptional regulator, transcriptional repressor of bet genes